jgi:nucleotide-binding universal stress UspA family protein
VVGVDGSPRVQAALGDGRGREDLLREIRDRGTAVQAVVRHDKGVTMSVPFTEILVPVDGSHAAERALGPAGELARRTGARLVLLSRIFTGEADVRMRYLASVAERHAPDLEVERRVVDRDSIPDAILEGLGRDTLVCMSSHGRGGLARGVMGSVTEALLRIIDRPTVVVGPHAGSDASFHGRVVACVDGSPESERAIEPARRWASALGDPLWLVAVVDRAGPAEGAVDGDVVESGYLAALARAEGVQAWDLLHSGSPARALADLAASETDPAALLVMATHGRTGWDRLHLGSVTTATIHAARVPVLVVPAGEHGGAAEMGRTATAEAGAASRPS